MTTEAQASHDPALWRAAHRSAPPDSPPTATVPLPAQLNPPEPATVWSTARGVPERLIWRGRRFQVSSRPVPWIDRSAWWQERSRVPMGTSETQEQRMWQLQVTAVDDGEILLLDLHPEVGAQWQVTAVHV